MHLVPVLITFGWSILEIKDLMSKLFNISKEILAYIVDTGLNTYKWLCHHTLNLALLVGK